MPRFETRAVLAAQYPTQRRNRAPIYLTHTVVIDDEGHEQAVCGRLQDESIADPHASDTSAAPTCHRCKNLDPRFVFGRK